MPPVNPFVDDKRGRVLNAAPSPTPDDDYTPNSTGAASIFDLLIGRRRRSALYPQLPANIAPRVNLREDWHVIGNQGYTGSCVGWGVANGVLQYEMVKKGRLTQDRWLSPKATWEAAKSGDEWAENNWPFLALEGTSVKTALDWHRKTGAALDEWMPNWGYCPFTYSDFVSVAAPYKIQAYFNLGADQLEWQRWMSDGHPLILIVKTDDYFMNAGVGPLTVFARRQNGLHGLHCVSLFGYARNAQGIATYTVRNSWGTGWGDNGFCYMSADYAVDAVLECWGVVV